RARRELEQQASWNSLLFVLFFFLRLFDANLRSVLQLTRDDAERSAHHFVALLDSGLDLHVRGVTDARVDRHHLHHVTLLHEHHALQRLAIRPFALALLFLVHRAGRALALQLLGLLVAVGRKLLDGLVAFAAANRDGLNRHRDDIFHRLGFDI